MALLNVSGVSLGYEGHPIVSNLDFRVEKGDYLCIVGENGSGKSTLMKTILGQKHVINGKIEFSDGLKQNEIGYLPQQTEVQKDFPASVKEIVLSGCINSCGFRPFYSKSQKALAEENMKKLGIKCAVQETREDIAAENCETDTLCTGNCAGCDIDHSTAK